MADVKISALPAATTPLAGTELVPIVQSGVTSRVSVANMTAGRSVAASAVTVDANSASDAVRITQTGSGNALVVEDSSNPDATPFVVDQNGLVVAGHIQPLGIAPNNAFPTIQVQANIGSADFASVGVANWVAGAQGTGVQLSKSRSGAIGTRGIVSNNDALGRVQFNGDDGVAFIAAARIEAAVDGTPGTNDMPGRLVFSTTADGASSPTERMRITNSGLVGIGGTPGASVNLDVRGTGSRYIRARSDDTTGGAIGYVGAEFGPTTSLQMRAGNGYTFLVSTAAADSMLFGTANTERMRIDANGAILIGRSSSITYPAGVNPRLQIAGSSASETFVNVSRWVGNANGAVFDFLKSRGAAVGTNAIVQSGDTLGEVRFSGDDGANFLVGASIAAQVDGTPGTNDMPTRLIFVTTPDGAGSPIERMRITAAGNVVAGGSVALATTATDGFLYVPTCAGVPTGTPTAITGMAPIVVNTTNNKLYFYSGGAWRDAGP